MNASYHNETPEQREARWKRVESMSNEEIAAAAAKDPDWAGIDLASMQGWRVVRPNGKVVVPVEIDEKTVRFFDEHHLSFAGVLKAFAAAQEKNVD